MEINNKTSQKIYSLLGLAQRGRNIVSGEDMMLEGIRTGAVYCVLVAEDASAGTQKMYNNKCDYYDVPCYLFGTKEGIGHAIGKELRSAVGILEEGFSNSITALLESSK